MYSNDVKLSLVSMNKFVYNVLKYFTTLVVVTLLFNSPDLGSRELLLIATFLIFLLVFKIGYKAYNKITPSLFFYVFVCFYSLTLSSYQFLWNSHIEKINTQVVRLPRHDHFALYFYVFVVVSIVLLFWFFTIKKTTLKNPSFDVGIFLRNIHLKGRALVSLQLITIFGFIAFIIVGRKVSFLVFPTTVFWLSTLIIQKKNALKNRSYLLPIILSLMVPILLINARFIFAALVFPLFLIFLISRTNSPLSLKEKIRSLLFILGVVSLVALYGIVSEYIKLVKLSGGDFSYDLSDLFSNFYLLRSAIQSQVYRVFSIWSHLGWNIIEYVDTHGYFYGLSYLNSISDYVGIPNINLPKLSAEMIGANYAQPGLLAEGYANFGFIGAVLNILSVFFLMDILYQVFLIKKNIIFLMLSIVPTGQVFLDGGTLNSYIFLSFFTVILLFPIRNVKAASHQ